jgi:hypothetical protein
MFQDVMFGVACVMFDVDATDDDAGRMENQKWSEKKGNDTTHGFGFPSAESAIIIHTNIKSLLIIILNE